MFGRIILSFFFLAFLGECTLQKILTQKKTYISKAKNASNNLLCSPQITSISLLPSVLLFALDLDLISSL